MTTTELERIAMEVVSEESGKLPAHLRNKLDAVPVFYSADCDTDLLGLFEGNSLLDGDPADADQCPRITLFLKNLWDEAGRDLASYRHETRITWLHEVGHYFGWEEQDLAERGLG